MSTDTPDEAELRKQDAEITTLKAELTASCATVEEMREALGECLLVLATFKITDQQCPYYEIGDTYRQELLKTHDLVFDILSRNQPKKDEP